MEQKPEIPFATFQELDVALGTITHAEVVPDADKLLKLTVEVGEEKPRQIVSGIREYVSPEALVGVQCPFVLNLPPRTIKGVESQGMILAVGSAQEFALLHPHVPVTPGARVR